MVVTDSVPSHQHALAGCGTHAAVYVYHKNTQAGFGDKISTEASWIFLLRLGINVGRPKVNNGMGV